MTLKNLSPPHSYTIEGEGKGGIAGFAKGGAGVNSDRGGASVTLLKYAAKADVGARTPCWAAGWSPRPRKSFTGFFSRLSTPGQRGVDAYSNTIAGAASAAPRSSSSRAQTFAAMSR